MRLSAHRQQPLWVTAVREGTSECWGYRCYAAFIRTHQFIRHSKNSGEVKTRPEILSVCVCLVWKATRTHRQAERRWQTRFFNPSRAPLADVLEYGISAGFAKITGYFTSESSASRFSSRCTEQERSLCTSPNHAWFGGLWRFPTICRDEAAPGPGHQLKKLIFNFHPSKMLLGTFTKQVLCRRGAFHLYQRN